MRSSSGLLRQIFANRIRSALIPLAASLIVMVLLALLYIPLTTFRADAKIRNDARDQAAAAAGHTQQAGRDGGNGTGGKDHAAGHYRVAVGIDDEQRELSTMDAKPQWRNFSQTFADKLQAQPAGNTEVTVVKPKQARKLVAEGGVAAALVFPKSFTHTMTETIDRVSRQQRYPQTYTQHVDLLAGPDVRAENGFDLDAYRKDKIAPALQESQKEIRLIALKWDCAGVIDKPNVDCKADRTARYNAFGQAYDFTVKKVAGPARANTGPSADAAVVAGGHRAAPTSGTTTSGTETSDTVTPGAQGQDGEPITVSPEQHADSLTLAFRSALTLLLVAGALTAGFASAWLVRRRVRRTYGGYEAAPDASEPEHETAPGALEAGHESGPATRELAAVDARVDTQVDPRTAFGAKQLLSLGTVGILTLALLGVWALLGYLGNWSGGFANTGGQLLGGFTPLIASLLCVIVCLVVATLTAWSVLAIDAVFGRTIGGFLSISLVMCALSSAFGILPLVPGWWFIEQITSDQFPRNLLGSFPHGHFGWRTLSTVVSATTGGFSLSAYRAVAVPGLVYACVALLVVNAVTRAWLGHLVRRPRRNPRH